MGSRLCTLHITLAKPMISTSTEQLTTTTTTTTASLPYPKPRLKASSPSSQHPVACISCIKPPPPVLFRMLVYLSRYPFMPEQATRQKAPAAVFYEPFLSPRNKHH
ncbi:hypothetical protein F4820DRAFT_83013 [Hypoxylon rubiginosum]|uniref:Uncharacterized protein n=1 Tax=Hypoxylon rubiginosum TaxID=110542 RepID=A0ACB9YPF5_9PEZI|nr:hypothetical protein F4820DRAFT_83013 [Hypoxylon rubiginosum]